MSTPTTARGALLRRAGTLLVAAALVGGPATSAFADPTASPTDTPTVSAGPTASASASPAPTATGSGDTTPTTSPSTPGSPSPTSPAPSPSNPAPSPSTTATRGSTPTTAPADRRLAGASASRLADAAAAAAPQSAYAAAFIARTLAAGGDHYVYPGSTFFDGGNTIDAILALDGIGAGSDAADAAYAYLEDNLGGYIGTDYDSLYAGSTAKTVLAVVAHGGDPTSFGGLDLVAQLKSTEGAVEPGRFSDLPVDCGFDPCDYSNTIGQSLAIIALVRAGQPLSTASVDFLLAQQCTDGGFRITMGGEGCTSDADATAFAVQALVAAGSGATAAAADQALLAADPATAAADGLDWLADAQLASGAFESDDGAANANTTGVAAQAFAAGGRDAELADAQAFLVSLQYGCTSPAALRGGIAFSATTRSASTPSDADLRATPQAALGLSGQTLLSTSAEGATSGTTATPCATTTPSPTTTTPSSTVQPTEGDGGSDPSETVEASATGSLAQTGSDLLAPALLGLLLVVVGVVAVYTSTRRRGAHA